ncbi:MAG: hypothetical protein MUQ56_06255 [Thermoleophilia bacterium]|nr:hypothetical protein [Thermoleophilia bacterium]
MSKAMQGYLDALIEAGEDGAAEVQIVFNPGMGQMAGGLRHARRPGTDNIMPDLYELCLAAKPGPDAPIEIRKLDFVVISQVFDADAVQRVVMQVGSEKPTIVTTRQ